MERDKLNKFMAQLGSQIQDNPATNQLVDGEHFTPAQIEFAVLSSLDKMENTPPLISLSQDLYPFTLVIRGAVINLMETLEFVDTRNSLAYQDNGLSVKDTHEDQYGRMALKYYNMFVNELRQYKSSKNIEMSMSPMEGV